MQRGPFTRQHAPDPTIKSLTKVKLKNLGPWNLQNKMVWHDFFGIYMHFLMNRAMGFLSKAKVFAQDSLGELTPAAQEFRRAFLNCYITNAFKTGAERYLSGARHHMGDLLADFPRSINDFWGEVNNFGGWNAWIRAGGADLKTKNNLFSPSIWLQRAFETKGLTQNSNKNKFFDKKKRQRGGGRPSSLPRHAFPLE